MSFFISSFSNKKQKLNADTLDNLKAACFTGGYNLLLDLLGLSSSCLSLHLPQSCSPVAHTWCSTLLASQAEPVLGFPPKAPCFLLLAGCSGSMEAPTAPNYSAN